MNPSTTTQGRLVALALTLAGLVATVACSTPTPAPTQTDKNESNTKGKSKSSSDDGDDDDDDSAVAKTPAGNATPPSAAPPPTSDPKEAEWEQCFSGCLGNNPALVELDGKLSDCADKCGENDDACVQTCDQQLCVGAAQQQCDTIFGCLDRCDQQVDGAGQD